MSHLRGRHFSTHLIPQTIKCSLKRHLSGTHVRAFGLFHLSRPACDLRFSEGHTHPQRALSLLLHPSVLAQPALAPSCLRSLFVHHWCLRIQPSSLSDKRQHGHATKVSASLTLDSPLHPSLSGFNGNNGLGLRNRSSIMSPPVCWKLLQRDRHEPFFLSRVFLH